MKTLNLASAMSIEMIIYSFAILIPDSTWNDSMKTIRTEYKTLWEQSKCLENCA